MENLGEIAVGDRVFFNNDKKAIYEIMFFCSFDTNICFLQNVNDKEDSFYTTLEACTKVNDNGYYQPSLF